MLYYGLDLHGKETYLYVIDERGRRIGRIIEAMEFTHVSPATRKITISKCRLEGRSTKPGAKSLTMTFQMRVS